MKTLYTSLKCILCSILLLNTIQSGAQNLTTTIASANCSFTYNFNSSGEGFSSPSIYSDANDYGLYWDGTKLLEITGSAGTRNASTISSIYTNTEISRTTLGFDYVAPANSYYRIRVISGVFSPPLEILASTANGPNWTLFPSTSGSLCLELQDADLNFGQYIRYEITIQATGGGEISIDNFRRSAANAPLPVTFMGFIAKENTDGSIKLLWNVADEVNLRGYDVQTSRDGVNFTSLSFVPAAGVNNYNYQTAESIKGTQYFRIRNVDIDGRYKYSGIIRIQNDITQTGIRLYPVPTSDMLFIEHRKLTSEAVISIVSGDGKVMYRTVSQPNSYQTSVNVRNFMPGIYFVRYEEREGFAYTARFVKN